MDLKSLLGDESSFTVMSPKERAYFIEVLREELKNRDASSKCKQIREIVPIKQWIRSTYYCGNDILRLYPYWEEQIVNIFDEERLPENKISQIILSGSIGVGKTTAAEIMLMRKLYEMSCYENVNAMFHLMSKTSIMFLYFSVNKTQAEATGFGEMRQWVDNSPYFKECFRRRERIDSLLVFPEGITFTFGSGSNDSIGMSVIATLLDEANFVGDRGAGGNAEKASDMYAGIVNRANSRFIIDGGVNHALNILVSSATTENSATERQIAISRDDPHTYICAPAQWEVKPDKFSKKYFFVCKGTEHLEPHVVHSTDDINNFRLAEGVPKEKFVDNLTEFDDIDKEIQKLPPHLQSKFLKVPEDLRTGFETNIIRSLQDMGGVSTGSTGKLFTSMSVYKDCIDERFVHPFTANEIVLSTGDSIQIKDYLRTSFRLKHPERPRFIHIDQSYRTDSTGITCGYVDNVIVDEQTGMKKPVIGVDFMLRINPPSPPRKIAIYKIRNFIVWLGTAFGMKIGKVTYDIFNSEESRQILEEMGFNVGYQSVDRTDKAYLDLVEIMYEGRFKTYDYPIFKYELFNLVHYRDKRKVDHLKTISNDASAINGSGGYSGKGSGQGSKDVSDSVAGMVENILQFSISEESGGYQNNIDDFLYVNKLNGDFEFDAMSAEDLIDKQIDNMIEEFEYSGDITTGGYLDGTQSWF